MKLAYTIKRNAIPPAMPVAQVRKKEDMVVMLSNEMQPMAVSISPPGQRIEAGVEMHAQRQIWA
jgi:hypothetical protein